MGMETLVQVPLVFSRDPIMWLVKRAHACACARRRPVTKGVWLKTQMFYNYVLPMVATS